MRSLEVNKMELEPTNLDALVSPAEVRAFSAAIGNGG